MTKRATQQERLGFHIYQPEKMCLTEKKELAEKLSNAEFNIAWSSV